MKKKVISMMLVGAMTATMLTAGSWSAETVKAADDLSEKQDISIWLYKDDYKVYDSYSENPVVTYLNDKFNCKLDFQQPAMGSEQEQFSLMLGTGSYTDVMEITYSQAGVSTLFADDVIRDLAPYVDEYMPNFSAFLNAPENADVKEALYDSEGHLFTIPMGVRTRDELRWGGMVYRRDILDTMTGGNVAFPSGNENPTTVEDWEYMLEQYSNYFAASGMADYACLILPAEGFFATGELLTGFDTAADFFVDDNGEVKYGPTQEGFYNYLVKMKEWFEKGYIYKDFASRTNDVFYLPNTALTYGGAAGIWFGMSGQLDDVMSMPDYNLIVDVKPMASPLGEGCDKLLAVSGLENGRANQNQQGFVVSTACSEEKTIRFLTLSDYLFSEEGMMLRSYGLTADQGAADNKYYQEGNLAGGAYTVDGDKFTYAEPMVPGVGEIATQNRALSYLGGRLPGLLNSDHEFEYTSESSKNASEIWKGEGIANNYPGAIAFEVDDNDVTTDNYSSYHDYLVTMVPKFIMGTEELTPDTFAAFVEKMNDLGVTENTEIYQKYYDAFSADK